MRDVIKENPGETVGGGYGMALNLYILQASYNLTVQFSPTSNLPTINYSLNDMFRTFRQERRIGYGCIEHPQFESSCRNAVVGPELDSAADIPSHPVTAGARPAGAVMLFKIE